jgi:hypothetical protein
MISPSSPWKPGMLLTLGASVALWGACSSSASNAPQSANGGAISSGGETGNGGSSGSTSATGGSVSSGGISGTGGAHATGGTTASGSGGTTSVSSLPPACPKHTTLSCAAIDSTKTFGSLSQDEVSALCDCEIIAYGGLGTSRTCMCADGSMAINTNPTSKEACIAAYNATAACTWLMSDYFKCMNLMQDPCNMRGMAISLGDPSCAGGMNTPACAGK